MIRFLLLFVLLLSGLAFGYLLADLDGFVLIGTHDLTIEMSIISAMLMVFAAIITFLVIEWLLKRLFRWIRGSQNWLGSFSRRRQQKAFYSAICASTYGDNHTALSLLKKTFNGNFQGTNYLLAAHLDNAVNNGTNSLRYLNTAQQYSTAKFAAIIQEINIKVQLDQHQQALSTLDALSDEQKRRKPIITLWLSIMAKQQQWALIKERLPSLKKQLGSEYIDWMQRATQGEFAEIASKSGANALKEKWRTLSRNEQAETSNQLVYIQLLLDQGLSQDAEETLLSLQKKRPIAPLLPLFRQISHNDASASIRYIEELIKQSPSNANLYSILASIAFNTDDMVLSEKALSKAIKLSNDHQDKALLALVFERKHEYAKANNLYKELVNAPSKKLRVID